MHRLRLTLAALLAASLGATSAPARTLDIVFLPPTLEPRNVCTPGPSDKPDELQTEGGDEDLTDRMRIRFIDRHIKRLVREDPVRWFAFIGDLIDWRARIDPSFAGVDATLAKIDLHIAAGQLDALTQAALVPDLAAQTDDLFNAQKMALAQLYMEGTGVEVDIAFAQELIRDAAFAGHANALLDIARMDLQGTPMPGWDAPLDLTVTMAFGGLLGQMDRGVCRRAERLAQEYTTGTVVSHNADVARAWLRFAADMGSARAAWRMVERQLNAPAAEKDNVEMLRYLELAVARGITLDEGQVAAVEMSGADVDTVREILGFNHSEDAGTGRPQLSPLFRLSVNIDGQEADEDGLYLDYLREVTRLPNAPGRAFTRLGKEVLVKRGRWAGEAEAQALFTQAAERGDAEGQYELARLLVRYRDDPVQLNRAADLWADSVSRHGMETAMNQLDALYRCKAPDAPRLWEAEPWAEAYAATEHRTVPLSATDLVALDPYKEPWTIARLQSQALDGRIESLARHVQRVQLDPFASERAQRIWARRLDRSDKALEVFAELEFELATNPAERTRAIELFRRVYLNNGVTTALDLAIALTEDNARVPEVADEILRLLDQAANRGEGAAIRLKARLLSGQRSERSVYEEYAQEIEDRGDFLAMMFALPHVAPEKRADYFDRAAQQMNCSTKDVEEMADAHTILGDAAQAYRWKQIGLTIAGKHVLSKLRLSDIQLAAFDTGAAPDREGVAARAVADGDAGALRTLYRLTSDPDLEGFDPDLAADHLLALVTRGNAQDKAWVLGQFRRAPRDVQDAVMARFDMGALYRQLGQGGDVAARTEYGLMLRDRATTRGELAEAAKWLLSAAEGGHVAAMAAYGEMLGQGQGVVRDVPGALHWLDQAAASGDRGSKRAARLLRLSGS
ncbi:tetratricopeptide repeat protein [Pseudaestuariivita atlantica]|uniref:Sel1 repeat family protein n=1 Tax=Pseudaestuariivita atlantica TaxID=1317121 RepID=A0A0L1JNF5_9RHOB|nr:SEL1-like repeat protein [Pseudaestuariivita atlantica]KNG93295.1 hypothetical protein ATO11_12665 [Pseudaestuariivita atlantica]